MEAEAETIIPVAVPARGDGDDLCTGGGVGIVDDHLGQHHLQHHGVVGDVQPPPSPPSDWSLLSSETPPLALSIEEDGAAAAAAAAAISADTGDTTTTTTPTTIATTARGSSSSSGSGNYKDDRGGISKLQRRKRRRPMGMGLRVLEAEAAALVALAALYRGGGAAEGQQEQEREGQGRDDGEYREDEDGDSPSRQFDLAVQTIVRSRRLGAKLVVTGVGKSGHIGRKVVATCQSLGVAAVFLHATEALHGDMGIVGADDTLLVISSSGKTIELIHLLDHLGAASSSSSSSSSSSPPLPLSLVVLSSQATRHDCQLLRCWDGDEGGDQEEGAVKRGIHLAAPLPEPEESALGVAAPTMSTTAALALGDALAMAVAEELHGGGGGRGHGHDGGMASVFGRNHPGGTIGERKKKKKKKKVW